MRFASSMSCSLPVSFHQPVITWEWTGWPSSIIHWMASVRQHGVCESQRLGLRAVRHVDVEPRTVADMAWISAQVSPTMIPTSVMPASRIALIPNSRIGLLPTSTSCSARCGLSGEGAFRRHPRVSALSYKQHRHPPMPTRLVGVHA